MSNALHDYARLFEKYAANNNGMGIILAGEDCLALANEMLMDADAIETENAKLRELVRALDWCTENADVRDKCDRCPLEQSDACEPECEVMMRELGVESKE